MVITVTTNADVVAVDGQCSLRGRRFARARYSRESRSGDFVPVLPLVTLAPSSTLGPVTSRHAS